MIMKSGHYAITVFRRVDGEVERIDTTGRSVASAARTHLGPRARVKRAGRIGELTEHLVTGPPPKGEWGRPVIGRILARNDVPLDDTRPIPTGILVEEASIYPRRCERCRSATDEMIGRADTVQLRGAGSWSWQCGGCGGITTLTRAEIMRRHREWKAEQGHERWLPPWDE